MAKGFGPLLLLGGLGALVLAKKRSSSSKAIGISVNSDCTKVDIVDEESFFVHMWDVYTKQRANGVSDQFEIANAIVDSVSPNCKKFPDDLHSPSQLDLYSRAIKFATIELSKEEGISISELLKHPLAGEFGKWLEHQKNRLIFDAPSDDKILVIEDGDQILVGQRWVMDVFMPTMKSIPSIIFTQGTAPAMAGAILEKTTFVNEDGEPISVDLKESELGKELVETVTHIAKAYVRAANNDADQDPNINEVAAQIDIACPLNASMNEILSPGCMIAQQFGRFE